MLASIHLQSLLHWADSSSSAQRMFNHRLSLNERAVLFGSMTPQPSSAKRFHPFAVPSTHDDRLQVGSSMRGSVMIWVLPSARTPDTSMSCDAVAQDVDRIPMHCGEGITFSIVDDEATGIS